MAPAVFWRRPGFQGMSVERYVTTLGRGGSDTTAVALAAVLEARLRRSTPMCRVFSTILIGAEARKLARVSYEEMLEISATGGRVLSLRSVEFARNHRVPMHCAVQLSDLVSQGPVI